MTDKMGQGKLDLVRATGGAGGGLGFRVNRVRVRGVQLYHKPITNQISQDFMINSQFTASLFSTFFVTKK